VFQLQSRRSQSAFAIALLALALPSLAFADEAAEPTVNEQIQSLESMCAASADARVARQAEEPLYDRLGGAEKIRECVTEIIRLHDINPHVDRFMDDVDQEKLIDGVTQFVVANSGGEGEYTGRSMPDAHKHLELTNADFLSAGGDVMQAMQNMEYGEEEIEDMVCVLVSLRAAVVIESDKVLD